MNRWTLKKIHEQNEPPFWEITDGRRSFTCEDEEDAEWLCGMLNFEDQA